MEKTLWTQYFEEREGKTVFENEHGFICVVMAKEVFYVEHLFIKKESRGKKIAHAFEIFAINLAKSKGYKSIMGSVSIRTKDPEFSLKMMIDHGYKLSHTAGEMIYVKKDL